MPHQENKLSTFEKDMKAFTRALDQALLPKPKLLEVGLYRSCISMSTHIKSIVAVSTEQGFSFDFWNCDDSSCS